MSKKEVAKKLAVKYWEIDELVRKYRNLKRTAVGEGLDMACEEYQFQLGRRIQIVETIGMLGISEKTWSKARYEAYEEKYYSRLDD